MNAANTSKARHKCFVCLQTLLESYLTNIGNITLTLLLRNIIRYVNPMENISSVDYSSAGKKLCTDCSNLLQKLNAIHEILEETRLRLNHCIREVVAVMEEADEDVRSCQSPPNFLPNEEALRHELLMQCIKTLELTPPFLRLKRMKIQPLIKSEVDTLMAFEQELTLSRTDANADLTPEHVDFEDPEPVSFTPPNPEPTETPEDETGSSVADDEDIITLVKPAPTPKSAPEDTLSGIHPQSKDGMIICRYCSKPFGTAYMDQHYQLAHRNYYLIECKKESVSFSQFTQIIEDVLFPGLLKPRKCIVCGKQFRVQRIARNLRLHLVRRHVPFLRKKLLELQNDPVVMARIEALPSRGDLDAPALNFVTGTLGVKTKLECGICGRLLYPQSFGRHQKTNCLQPYARGYVVGKDKKQCPYCQRWMNGSSLHRHRKYRLCKALKIKMESEALDC